MEELPIALPEENPDQPLTRADVERQLSALSQRISEKIEESARQEAARREALDTREEELLRREMTAKAREMLESRGLPGEIAPALSCETAESLHEAVDALERAFRAAVQQGVEERLIASAPKAAVLKPLSELTDEEYYAAVSRNE